MLFSDNAAFNERKNSSISFRVNSLQTKVLIFSIYDISIDYPFMTASDFDFLLSSMQIKESKSLVEISDFQFLMDFRIS